MIEPAALRDTSSRRALRHRALATSDASRRGANSSNGLVMSSLASAECSSSTSHLTASWRPRPVASSDSVAAFSIFPDQNLGWRVRSFAPAGVLQPGDKVEEGPPPCFEIVCRGGLEYVTRLALQRAVVDRRPLLEAAHDFFIEAPHVDRCHGSQCRRINSTCDPSGAQGNDERLRTPRRSR